jgi:HEAT repeat protein
MLDGRMTHVMPTTENEKVLRSAAWLLGMLPAPECADALERTAIAASVAIERSDRYRSRTTVNAAIAGLGMLGTPEALHALGRLRRVIKDGATGNSVQKAMAAVAGKLGVAVDDVAEMSVPDYGLA